MERWESDEDEVQEAMVTAIDDVKRTIDKIGEEKCCDEKQTNKQIKGRQGR